MNKMIEIYVNGEQTQVPTDYSVDQLQQQYAASQQIAIALNNQVLPRRCWGERLLVAGDQVLMFNLVAGG
jgi:sulfur carrier protein